MVDPFSKVLHSLDSDFKFFFIWVTKLDADFAPSFESAEWDTHV